MIHIRPATAADVETVIDLAKAMHEESRYRDRPLSSRKLATQVTAMIKGEMFASPGCILVAEQDETIVGAIIAVVSSHWFSDQTFIEEKAVYVRPEHRGSSAFSKLVDGVEAYAERMGIKEINVGVSTGVHTELTLAMYRRKGYVPSGCIMEASYGTQATAKEGCSAH